MQKLLGNFDLVPWCLFAFALLVVSLVVHLSALLGIDPTEKWPGVMYIHVAIFPPFFAALTYALWAREVCVRSHDDGNRGVPYLGQIIVTEVIRAAPRWLRIPTALLFAYMFVNFVVCFFVLGEGLSTERRDGKYVLRNDGAIVRELSEAEFHRRQAYQVRMFSGHWMFFACASLTGLVGSAKLRSGNDETRPPEA